MYVPESKYLQEVKDAQLSVSIIVLSCMSPCDRRMLAPNCFMSWLALSHASFRSNFSNNPLANGSLIRFQSSSDLSPLHP
jgi:hypothetical protein